jgi:eukaryotic-like serine/threonine-protein kinase
MALQPGDQVTPSLRLVSPLGEGGMGSVWVAEHLGMNTEVAVKFVIDHRKQRKDAVRRFQREATLAAKLKHPHVVQIIDHGVTTAGDAFIAMELLEGSSLEERLEQGVLSPGETGMVLSQTAKALGKAHRMGIIHRDLKPANLFLQDSGYDIFVKVLDFGIAKQIEDEAGGTKLTASAAVLGTPLYMSPEALRGKGSEDPHVDLWALAVVAYEALAGRVPFAGTSFGDQTLLVHEGVYEPVTQWRPGLPAAVDDWFTRAFAKDRADRFQSLDELVEAFKMAVGASSLSITPPTDSDAPSVVGRSPSSRDGQVTETMLQPPRIAVADVLANKTTSSPLASAIEEPPRDKRRWAVVALLAVIAAGVAFGLTSSSAPSDPAFAPISVDPPPDTAAATTSSARPDPSVEVAPTMVAITVDSTPQHADVHRGNTWLGRTPGPIELPQSQEPIELTFSAEGYLPRALPVAADRSRMVTVNLDPEKKTPGVALPGPLAKPKPVDDYDEYRRRRELLKKKQDEAAAQ